MLVLELEKLCLCCVDGVAFSHTCVGLKILYSLDFKK